MSHTNAPTGQETGMESFETVTPSAQTEVTAALHTQTALTGTDAYKALANDPMQKIAAKYGDDWYHLHGQGD